MQQRRARIRPAAAGRYPAIELDHWYPAAVLAHYVHRRDGTERGSPPRRALAEESFEFSGGEPRVGPWTHSRRGDRVVAPGAAAVSPDAV